MTVSKALNSPAPADTHLRLLSDVYAWKLEAGSRLSAAVKLTIAYDAARLDGADPRKLGVYRQDAADKTRWTYVGGVVDRAAGSVEADVSEPGAYAVLIAEYKFGDLANHWSREDVEALASRGIVTGDPDGSFRPNGKITRAEFVKLLLPVFANRAGANQGASGTFADVPQDAWYGEAVSIATTAAIVQGAGGKFRPTDPVTREEMAVMLYRALGIVTDDLDPEKLLSVFNDGAKVSGWARMQVAYAVKAGLLKGSGGRLNPGAAATRAEAATVLLRVLEAQGKIEK
ncbi:S-layer homology domain-containing protein [Cohnella rhizosphaerae]|uniref:S-layer homology domain-containing protein n=1 Tax=Cohnella rhizosphaerae TaxID=1457232 RepID=A0A9X4QX31_9BACL|nr:S-layer homology domain-containing protein [Cohnella rhizosphaerae]MDG0814168.1 S-layer homology domain-containing protein [Cohnella rhizosphaerae]